MDEITAKNIQTGKDHTNTTYRIHTLKEVYDSIHKNIDCIKTEIKCNNDLNVDAKNNLIDQMNTIRHLVINIECDWTY